MGHLAGQEYDSSMSKLNPATFLEESDICYAPFMDNYPFFWSAIDSARDVLCLNFNLS